MMKARRSNASLEFVLGTVTFTPRKMSPNHFFFRDVFLKRIGHDAGCLFQPVSEDESSVSEESLPFNMPSTIL